MAMVAILLAADLADCNPVGFALWRKRHPIDWHNDNGRGAVCRRNYLPALSQVNGGSWPGDNGGDP